MTKTPNTETHMAVDEKIKTGYTQRSMNEGFASASGVRPETAETGGRLTHPEDADRARDNDEFLHHIEEEEEEIIKAETGNSGLADN